MLFGIILIVRIFPITYKVNFPGKIFDTAAIIRIIGALAIIIALAILYAATKREIKDSMHLGNNAFLSEKVESPAVCGIIRPGIV